MIGYGAFITAVVNFLILAFIIFLLVRCAKKVIAEFEEPKKEEEPAGPTEIELAAGNPRRAEEAGHWVHRRTARWANRPPPPFATLHIKPASPI